MKALVISMSILLAAFFSFTPVFGQPPEDKPPQPQKTVDANTATDVNTAADANAVADPNAVVRARIEKFEGLGGALSGINTAGEEEIREWTRGRLDNRLDLILAAQKQNIAELKFLRELAVEEKAAKTTAAIDGILLDRQERFKGVIEELEKKSERLRRLSERDERRKEREQSSRERGRERTDRPKRDMP